MSEFDNRKKEMMKREREREIPHAATVLEGVGPTLESAIEVAMNLVLGRASLVEEGKFKESTDVGAFTGESDEDRDIGGVVFGVLPIRVEIDGPLVTSNREILARYVLSNSDPLRQRVPSYCEVV